MISSFGLNGLGVPAVVHSGDHHDRGVREAREHLAREVEARFAGHVDVAEDERDRRLLEQPPSCGGALGGDAVVAVRAEQACEEGPDLVLVVDDQDAVDVRRCCHLTRYRQVDAAINRL